MSIHSSNVILSQEHMLFAVLDTTCCIMQDPVPLMAKFGALYARPGHRVLITPRGDMLVRPTPLDHKLTITGYSTQHGCACMLVGLVRAMQMTQCQSSRKSRLRFRNDHSCCSTSCAISAGRPVMIMHCWSCRSESEQALPDSIQSFTGGGHQNTADTAQV